jgi:recA bacterial DNA recombination protein
VSTSLKRDPRLLDELLRTGAVQRAAQPAAAPRLLSTGFAALDAALGGGLVRGQLHEIAGPASAGGTALLRSALAWATRAGELCALVDPDDAFDPRPRDIDLRRLLWVRPRDPAQALRAAEIALEARFALVALDLGGTGAPPARIEGVHTVRFAFERKRRAADDHMLRLSGSARRPGDPFASAVWARLARKAERSGGALLVLSREARTGSFSATTIELERTAVRWEGAPRAPGRLLRGVEAIGAVARSRRGAPSGPLRIRLLAGATDPEGRSR